jgi:hypothetical protein
MRQLPPEAAAATDPRRAYAQNQPAKRHAAPSPPPQTELNPRNQLELFQTKWSPVRRRKSNQTTKFIFGKDIGCASLRSLP